MGPVRTDNIDNAEFSEETNMASDKDKGTDILDDFDLDSDSLPDIEDDLLDDDSSIDLPSEAQEGELEQYGVWVKTEPETVEESPEEITESPLSDLGGDLETPADREEEMLTQEEEELLSELEEHDDIEDEDIPLDLPELGAEEAGEEEEVEVALSDSTSIDEDFGGLGDVADASPSGDGDGSAVLEKIEKELFDIKNELAELKKELTLLRKPAGSIEEESEFDVQPVEAEAKGFFDDEEDETIALTGDELDNILNTADITEEAAEDTSLSVEEEPSALAEELEIPEAIEPEVGESELETEIAPPLAEESTEMDLEVTELPEIEEELEVPTIGEEIEELGGEISVGEEPVELQGEEIVLDLPDEEGPEEIALPIEAESPLATEETDEEPVELETDDAIPSLEAEEISLELPEVGTEEETIEELVDQEAEEAFPLLDDEISLDLPEEEGLEELSLPADTDASDLEILEELGETAEDISLELPEVGTEADVGTEEEPEVAETPQSEEPIDLEELAAPEEPIEDAEEISLELPEETIEPDLGLAEGDVEEATEIATEDDEALQPGPLNIEDELEALEELPSDETADEAVDLTLEDAPVSEGETSAEDVAMDAVQALPGALKSDIKTVLSYMDQLLESLPEDKIEEFAKSEYFEVYRKLFEELGIVK